MRPTPVRSTGPALSFFFILAVLIVWLLLPVVPAVAAHPPDPVLDWIGITNDTAIAAGTNDMRMDISGYTI